MAGCVEEKTCWWCRWHSWDHDRCILNGRIITGNEEACRSYTTSEEYEEYLEALWDKKNEKSASD